jgi:hypothetical protein
LFIFPTLLDNWLSDNDAIHLFTILKDTQLCLCKKMWEIYITQQLRSCTGTLNPGCNMRDVCLGCPACLVYLLYPTNVMTNLMRKRGCGLCSIWMRTSSSFLLFSTTKTLESSMNVQRKWNGVPASFFQVPTIFFFGTELSPAICMCLEMR